MKIPLPSSQGGYGGHYGHCGGAASTPTWEPGAPRTIAPPERVPRRFRGLRLRRRRRSRVGSTNPSALLLLALLVGGFVYALITWFAP